ncbi:MAG: hypothetical protein K1060chlam1_00493 [Candidatus Anoxychlamydiales bacterium]|nr:hypothetical protein [Candidatus Anoxychlamydiales bacterium]
MVKGMSNTYVSMSNGLYQLNPGEYEGFQISEEKSLDKSEEETTQLYCERQEEALQEEALQQDINTADRAKIITARALLSRADTFYEKKEFLVANELIKKGIGISCIDPTTNGALQTLLDVSTQAFNYYMLNLNIS